MSQKVHPRSLRFSYLTRDDQIWFSEQKSFTLLKQQLLFQQFSSKLFSQIYCFKTQKSQQNFYLFSKFLYRPVTNKVYRNSLLVPFSQKGYKRKYLPIKVKFVKKFVKK